MPCYSPLRWCGFSLQKYFKNGPKPKYPGRHRIHRAKYASDCRPISGPVFVKALSAKSNMTRLAGQIKRYRPASVAVGDERCADDLKALLPPDLAVDILLGESGLCQIAGLGDTDLVVTAVVGAAGLLPTLAAIDAGKDIALANKETLVMAGQMVMERAAAQVSAFFPWTASTVLFFNAWPATVKQMSTVFY